MLRHYRYFAGLSQNAWARAAGIDPAYVNRLERDKTNATTPSIKVLENLAQAAGDYASSQVRTRLLLAAGYCPCPIVHWQTGIHEIHWKPRTLTGKFAAQELPIACCCHPDQDGGKAVRVGLNRDGFSLYRLEPLQHDAYVDVVAALKSETFEVV